MGAKRKRLPIEPDHGPPERYQHGDVIVDSPTETAGVQAKRVMTQRVLDRCWQRDLIDSRQYAAGDALFRLWCAAGRSPRLTVNLIAVGGVDESAEDRKAQAWGDLNQALRAVGQRLSPILVHVCLADGTASAWARKTGRHPNSGIAILGIALDALADYFRLPGNS